MTTSNHEVRYVPTPRQIKQSCRHIQATWSPKDRVRRTVRRPQLWMFPIIQIAEMGLTRNWRY